MPSFAVHVRDVRVHGELGAERREDVDLRRRVRDVIVAADHVRDPVEHVLDRRGEVVGRAAVGADDHEVGEVLVLELDPAADRVLPADDALVGHPEADRALVDVGLALLRRAARRTVRTSSIRSSWKVTGPSQSIPSQRSDSWICSIASATSRLVSVFSIRSRHSPPCWRANSQLNRNVRTPPTCRKPVGLGAMRTRTLIPCIVGVSARSAGDGETALRTGQAFAPAASTSPSRSPTSRFPVLPHFRRDLIGGGSDPQLFVWSLGWWPHAVAARAEPVRHPRALGAARKQPRLDDLGSRARAAPRARDAHRRARRRLQRRGDPAAGARRVDGVPALPAPDALVLAVARGRLPVRLLELPARPGARAPACDLGLPRAARGARRCCGSSRARSAGAGSSSGSARCSRCSSPSAPRCFFTLALCLAAGLVLGAARRAGVGGGGSPRRCPRSPAPTGSCAVIVSPFVYYAATDYQGVITPATHNPVDLVTFAFPTAHDGDRRQPRPALRTRPLPSISAENGQYLGLPAARDRRAVRGHALAPAGQPLPRARARSSPASRRSARSCACAATRSSPLPWRLVRDAPLFDNVIPARFALYVSLVAVPDRRASGRRRRPCRGRFGSS